MIKNFLEKQELDLRVRGREARPFDQKLTPDVVMTVSSVILVMTKSNRQFKNKVLINSAELASRTTLEFGKPAPDANTANEYDKFVGQVVQMLIYANVVQRINSQTYEVTNREILKFISGGLYNSIDFLYIFFREVLKQSEMKMFDEYFSLDNPTTKHYNELRDRFVNFIIQHTNIEKPTEPRRIIAKVLNLIAFYEKEYGSNRGSASKGVILLTDILYCRTNSRDTLKRKDVPRKVADKIFKSYNRMASMESRVKKMVRELSQDLSDMSGEPGKQIHHIFPKHLFPEYVSTPENLITLTPDEHYMKAHPENNTKLIDEEYQKEMLRVKKEIILKNPNVYNINVFNEMLQQTGIQI